MHLNTDNECVNFVFTMQYFLLKKRKIMLFRGSDYIVSFITHIVISFNLVNCTFNARNYFV